MVKDIPGYEGLYQITSDAQVINIKTGLIKKPWINNKGYLCIDLSKDGITSHKLLHRLYAEAFIPNPNNYPVVMHQDNDKLNICESNLVWGTYSENNAQAIRDGLKPLPIPENRKIFSIISSSNEVQGYFYGQQEILDEIGFGNIQMIQNHINRKTPLREGKYKGCSIVPIGTIKQLREANVQRSSPNGRVEPQAYGGRKMSV